MPPLRWGILGAGFISHDFLVGTSVLPKSEHLVIGVAARSLEKAQELAATHQVPKSYGSYEELVKDPEIDVVYIGVIHPHHLSLVKLALNHGKHVLCEKPLAMNVRETKEILELAKSKKLFLMEAVWSRFFPIYFEIRKQIENGSLGEVKHVLATLGFNSLGWKDAADFFLRKELGGGSCLAIGIYCIQLALMVFGEKPTKIISGGGLNADGVDEGVSGTLIFSNGRMATFASSFVADLPNEAVITGTKRSLKIKKPFWAPEKLEEVEHGDRFEGQDGGKLHSLPLPEANLKTNYMNSVGLHYQCEEVKKCIEEGKIESSIMSHADSLVLAEVMETVRKQAGVTYPQDKD